MMWRHLAAVGVRGGHRLLWRSYSEVVARVKYFIHDVAGKERLVGCRRLSSGYSGKGGRMLPVQGYLVHVFVRMQYICGSQFDFLAGKYM